MSRAWMKTHRKKLSRAVIGAGAIWMVVLGYNLAKPLPEGVSVSGPLRDAAGMEFLYDLTFRSGGRESVEQRIFDRILSMIDAADEFVVLDMFLFNGLHGGERAYRPLSGELVEHLVERRKVRPGLAVTFITDEINTFYGAYTSQEIAALRAAGIQVVTTRMTRARDSNPLYSAGWRMLGGWLGTGGPGWLPNLFGASGPKVTLRGYLKLPNFRANHRKLMVTEKRCLVTSANPHDASSFHSNIAFTGTGPVCADLLSSERAVVAFSGGDTGGWPTYASPGTDGDATSGEGSVQLVTEGKILDALLEDLGAAGPGDRVDLAMFYISERQVVKALLDADGRGAEVRLVLDPNKDAFGREKGGIPNRQVARELVTRSDGRIAVRWYDTHGEQYHTKLMMVSGADTVTVMGGSANLTRRNIGDYNLEADLRFVLPRDSPVASAAVDYFNRLFANRGGEYTLPFEAYRDDSWVKRITYRIQEFTGMSSF
ncbi:MAG: phospholipase D-like domain-containing protein [Longimicrobiales bacterium]